MGSKGSSKVTVGYRYSWDIQAGLGRGPVNELVAITADKKYVFAGTAGQVTQSTTIYIDKANLFGGEDTGGEGGIQGPLIVQFGDPDQLPPPGLEAIVSGPLPGFRGLVTTFFSGLISCYAASPKPWKYRVRRTTAGWDGDTWYPEKCTIRLLAADAEIDDTLPADALENLRQIHAMNPAHILYECATNRVWGAGNKLSAGDIDEAAYRAAADTLSDEGFGLCFRYNRQTSLDTFIQQILDHVGGVQYDDLETGKRVFKLIRDDYDPAELPLYTYENGIIAVQDDDSVSTDTAINEVIVVYHDPATDTDAEVRAQNLGAIQTSGLNSDTVEYSAIPTHDLAARVAQRDLELNSAGLTRLTIQFDRRGTALRPADVFRVALPDRGIENMILRVGAITEQSDGSLVITAIQDVFGLPATNYSSGQQGGNWIFPDTTARPVTAAALFEIPYAMLAGTLTAADLDYLTDEVCYVGVLAQAPSSMSVNYRLQTRAGTAEFTDAGTGDWTPATRLTRDADPSSEALWVAFGTQFRAGEALLVNDELLRVDSYDVLTGILTVGRGCCDTLPAEHFAGATVWRIEDADADERQYIGGETVEARLLTQTRDETLDATAANVIAVTVGQRQARPYLPGAIAVNGVYYPETVANADAYTLTLAHRDRVLQADQLIDCMSPATGLEPGVVYVATLTDYDNGAEVWSQSFTADTLTLPYSTATTGGTVHQLRLSSQRAGLTSRAQFTTLLPAGTIVTNGEPDDE